MQTCTKCGVTKDASEFYKRKRYPNGRGTEERCKECVRLATRTYHQTNRTVILAKRRAMYAADPEKYREQVRDQYRKAPEKFAARAKRWRTENRDRKNSMNQERRARQRSQTVESVDRLEVYRRSDGVCGICKHPVTAEEFQVDHIQPLSKGGAHSYANTQPAHPRCNQSKKDRVL